MYATIRKYTMTNSRELASRVEEEFVPTLRDIPGFVAYYWIDQGDGTNATVTICEDRSGCEESTRRAAEWIRANAADAVQGAPDVTTGELTIAVVPAGARF